jgi:hypothetical protein
MGMDGQCGFRNGNGVPSNTPCDGGEDCTAPGESCLGLSLADMDAYTAFIETVNFPPNPFRNPDNTFPPTIPVPNQNGSSTPVNGNPLNGQTAFVSTNPALDAGVFSCDFCHALPTGTTNDLFDGNLEGESQDFKIPHLRNMYEKVGFNVIRAGLQSGDATTNNTNKQMKKGFGFIHDGAVSLTEFLAAPVFQSNTTQERDLFAFMLAFPTESAPAIGRQQHVDNANKNQAPVTTLINALIAQAELGACDLIVKGSLGGVKKGYAYNASSDVFVADSVLDADISESALRGSVGGADVITYTAVPPGAGRRFGIDRDRDGFRDRDEAAAATDPASPNSNAWGYQP